MISRRCLTAIHPVEITKEIVNGNFATGYIDGWIIVGSSPLENVAMGIGTGPNGENCAKVPTKNRIDGIRSIRPIDFNGVKKVVWQCKADSSFDVASSLYAGLIEKLGEVTLSPYAGINYYTVARPANYNPLTDGYAILCKSLSPDYKILSTAWTTCSLDVSAYNGTAHFEIYGSGQTRPAWFTNIHLE